MLFFVHRALKTLNAGEGFRSFWIGLDDKKHENNWYWIDGKKANEHETNWSYNEPNNWKSNEDCAEVYTTTFQFNDENCMHERFALCEIDRGRLL